LVTIGSRRRREIREGDTGGGKVVYTIWLGHDRGGRMEAWKDGERGRNGEGGRHGWGGVVGKERWAERKVRLCERVGKILGSTNTLRGIHSSILPSPHTAGEELNIEAEKGEKLLKEMRDALHRMCPAPTVIPPEVRLPKLDKAGEGAAKGAGDASAGDDTMDMQ
jgi:hypothetical protein